MPVLMRLQTNNRKKHMNNIDTTITIATDSFAELMALASSVIDDLESFGSDCAEDYRAEMQAIVDRFRSA
jgi:hypothetical protein